MSAELKNTLLRLIEADNLAKSKGSEAYDAGVKADPIFYQIRNSLVYQAMGLATRDGLEAGMRIDKSDGIEWPIFFIMLPVQTGDQISLQQVAWHIYNSTRAWDDATPEECQKRCINMAVL